MNYQSDEDYEQPETEVDQISYEVNNFLNTSIPNHEQLRDILYDIYKISSNAEVYNDYLVYFGLASNLPVARSANNDDEF